MGITKTKVSQYLNKRLGCDYVNKIGKEPELESSSLKTYSHDKKMITNKDDYETLHQQFKSHILPKETKDYKSVLQSIEQYFSNLTAYKKLGKNGYMNCNSTNTTNKFLNPKDEYATNMSSSISASKVCVNNTNETQPSFIKTSNCLSNNISKLFSNDSNEIHTKDTHSADYKNNNVEIKGKKCDRFKSFAELVVIVFIILTFLGVTHIEN